MPRNWSGPGHYVDFKPVKPRRKTWAYDALAAMILALVIFGIAVVT